MKRMMTLLGVVAVLPLAAAAANDYPTQDRVEYVFQCMHDHGGENYTTLYQCSCSMDYIADHLKYDDYVVADTFTRGANAMGERGSIFREIPEARPMRNQLAQLKAEAAQRCFAPQVSGR